jgi:uncharacterized protein YlaI
MAERNIHCIICNKYVGIIRDAKLAIGLEYICKDCTNTVILALSSTMNTKKSDFRENFKSPFNQSWF